MARGSDKRMIAGFWMSESRVGYFISDKSWIIGHITSKSSISGLFGYLHPIGVL